MINLDDTVMVPYKGYNFSLERASKANHRWIDGADGSKFPVHSVEHWPSELFFSTKPARRLDIYSPPGKNQVN